MHIRELTVPEFDGFTEQFSSGSIYQTSEYGYVMNNNNFDMLILGLVDQNNAIYAATLLLIEKGMVFKYAYAPRGFLIDYNNYGLLETFTKLIKKYCSKRDIIAIKLSPEIVRFTYDGKKKIPNMNYEQIFSNLKKLNYFHFGYNHFFEGLRPRFVAKVDLQKPYYEVFGSMKKNYRTKIRSAALKGVKIYRGDERHINYLFLNENITEQKTKYYQDCFYFFKSKNMIEFYYAKLDTEQYLKHIKSKYDYYEKLSAEVNQKMIDNAGKSSDKLLNKKLVVDHKFDKYKKDLVRATKLLREHPEGIIAASAMIIKFRDEVYVIRDCYNKDIKDTNPKQLLMWKLLEKFSKQGFHYLNLGGLTEVELPNNPYHGLNHSKMNYGSQVYEYIGDLELVTNQALYFMYRQTSSLKNILKK